MTLVFLFRDRVLSPLPIPATNAKLPTTAFANVRGCESSKIISENNVYLAILATNTSMRGVISSETGALPSERTGRIPVVSI